MCVHAWCVFLGGGVLFCFGFFGLLKHSIIFLLIFLLKASCFLLIFLQAQCLFSVVCY